jgi:hypothetical protein
VGQDSTERYPGSKNSGHTDYGKWRGTGNNDPVFDNNLVTNVTAQLGGTAFLHCRVRNLGERPVSASVCLSVRGGRLQHFEMNRSCFSTLGFAVKFAKFVGRYFGVVIKAVI